MKRIVRGLVAGIIVSASACANSATLTNWGTLTSAVATDCGGVCNDANLLGALLDPANLSTQFAAGGGANELTADAAVGSLGPLPPSSLPRAEAHAEVLGGLSLPHLRVAAASDANEFAGAVAAAIQGYDYSGAAGTISVDVSLTGEVINGGSEQTRIGALVFLFSATDLAGFLGTPTSAADGYALAGAFLSSLDISFLDPANPGSLIFEQDTASAQGSITLPKSTVSIAVADGTVTAQQFYLATFLVAFADGAGQSVTSLNSLSVDFAAAVDRGKLAAAGVAVPLPASILLFIPALVGGFSRRRSV